MMSSPTNRQFNALVRDPSYRKKNKEEEHLEGLDKARDWGREENRY